MTRKKYENSNLTTDKPFKDYTDHLADTLLDMAGYSILKLKYLKEHKD